MRYHSCDSNNDSISDTRFVRQSLCCQSVLLPELGTSVCEVCLSQPVLTRPCVCCLFPAMAQGGDVLQSYLKNCCLHKESAPTDTQTSVACSNLKYSYSPFSQYSACCRRVVPHLNHSEAKEEPDVQRVPLMPSSLSVPPSFGSQMGGEGITGLRCQTNRTLRFYVLDVALNWPLAVRLGATRNGNTSLHQENGAQGLVGSDGSFATIVDLKDEVHYVLHRSPATTLTESLGKSQNKIPFFFT